MQSYYYRAVPVWPRTCRVGQPNNHFATQRLQIHDCMEVADRQLLCLVKAAFTPYTIRGCFRVFTAELPFCDYFLEHAKMS